MKKFQCKYKLFKFVNLPNWDGMKPDSLLVRKEITSNDEISNRDSGIGLSNSFFSNRISFRLVKWYKVEGRVPYTWLSGRYKYSRDERSPISVGRVPFKLLFPEKIQNILE